MSEDPSFREIAQMLFDGMLKEGHIVWVKCQVVNNGGKLELEPVTND